MDITLGGSYDDSYLYRHLFGGRFGGFQPSFRSHFEIQGSASGEKGIYLGLSTKPSIMLLANPHLGLNAALPVTLGLGLYNFYDIPEIGLKNEFGFTSVGMNLSAELNFIPDRLGQWTLDLGGKLLVLGDVAKYKNNNERTEFIFTSGLSSRLF
jgi:hypothetical protein